MRDVFVTRIELFNSQMNFGGKKEKSRDDLQQNLQSSVTKIQCLLSLDGMAPSGAELNGLLCGEGGIVQSEYYLQTLIIEIITSFNK